MEENVDVRALRAKFTRQASTLDNSNQKNASPKSPRPGFGGAVVPVTEGELVGQLVNRLILTEPPPPSAGPAPPRLPLTNPAKAASAPRAPPGSGARAAGQPGDVSRVKQTGEILQSIMLKQQRPPGVKPGPALTLAPPPSTTFLLPAQQAPRQRSAGDVTPLRRPLPPEGPLPLKPKRPPNVNLQPFLRSRRGPAPPGPKPGEGPSERRASLPALLSPPGLPSPPGRPPQFNKPKGLPRQVASVDFEEEQDPYDDIGSCEKSESCSDNSSQFVDRDGNEDDDEEDDDIYEYIDDSQVQVSPVVTEKKSKQEEKRQKEQEKKEKLLQQKKQNELKKNFQLQGEAEVVHTARVRHDWYGGGKLDLSVRQGESVEILRLKNNPGGKWLARSFTGSYGYISNTCVDIDYEAIKRKSVYFKRKDMSPLPPPPPDPPELSKLEPNNRDSSLLDDDDYDDVQPITEDFPPPPPGISCDPKVEKELKKKFKYEGPLTVLHTMMVDPNCVIKKPGAKDLHVRRGEVVEIIQLTDTKKALCRNSLGKYGYVLRSHLLSMEGDVYYDVDYSADVYDNEAKF